MCRLMAYIGPPALIADVVLWPDRSIIKQSYDARCRQQEPRLCADFFTLVQQCHLLQHSSWRLLSVGACHCRERLMDASLPSHLRYVHMHGSVVVNALHVHLMPILTIGEG